MLRVVQLDTTVLKLILSYHSGKISFRGGSLQFFPASFLGTLDHFFFYVFKFLVGYTHMVGSMETILPNVLQHVLF